MKKGINKYLGALVMGTALVAVPACTDTWDEHYRTEDEYTANETLWELLESRDDLSNFRDIVAQARFYRDENHPAYTLNGKDTVFYTFKDVLSANTPITVWAPVNNALSEEDWTKFADMVKAKDYYNLQQQFIGNHVALYRKSMAKTGTETFRLINSKFAKLDYNKHMFQDANVTKSDIAARNGLLHVIDKGNEFFYNLYEYIKFSGDVSRYNEYLVARDTTYFLESASIEGLPDENGNPTYVDSVYFQDNMLFNYISYNPTGADAQDAWMNSMKMYAARINIEDSAYVLVIPSNTAWENATEMMKPYYNYGQGVYPRMSKVKITSTQGMTRDIKNARRTFPNGKGYETVDSLQAVNIDMDIISPLAFNINLQPQQNGTPWTKETFMNGGYKNCPYLLNTRGDTIRDVKDENGSIIWSKNSLFETGKLQEMSNGYAIITDIWNYPQDMWMRGIDMDVDYQVYYQSTSTRNEIKTISNEDAKNWIDDYGRCSEQRYLSVTGNSSRANPEIAFELDGYKKLNADVMSAKYDVQVVMVPIWYNTSDTLPDLPETEAEMPKSRLVFTLYGWTEDKIGNSNISYTRQTALAKNTISYRSEKVDTITIMEDVVFPLSYKNLNDAYPVLQVTSDKLTNAELSEGYTRSFNIDRIILKCKGAAE